MATQISLTPAQKRRMCYVQNAVTQSLKQKHGATFIADYYLRNHSTRPPTRLELQQMREAPLSFKSELTTSLDIATSLASYLPNPVASAMVGVIAAYLRNLDGEIALHPFAWSSLQREPDPITETTRAMQIWGDLFDLSEKNPAQALTINSLFGTAFGCQTTDEAQVILKGPLKSDPTLTALTNGRITDQASIRKTSINTLKTVNHTLAQTRSANRDPLLVLYAPQARATISLLSWLCDRLEIPKLGRTVSLVGHGSITVLEAASRLFTAGLTWNTLTLTSQVAQGISSIISAFSIQPSMDQQILSEIQATRREIQEVGRQLSLQIGAFASHVDSRFDHIDRVLDAILTGSQRIETSLQRIERMQSYGLRDLRHIEAELVTNRRNDQLLKLLYHADRTLMVRGRSRSLDTVSFEVYADADSQFYIAGAHQSTESQWNGSLATPISSDQDCEKLLELASGADTADALIGGMQQLYHFWGKQGPDDQTTLPNPDRWASCVGMHSCLLAEHGHRAAPGGGKFLDCTHSNELRQVGKRIDDWVTSISRIPSDLMHWKDSKSEWIPIVFREYSKYLAAHLGLLMDERDRLIKPVLEDGAKNWKQTQSNFSWRDGSNIFKIPKCLDNVVGNGAKALAAKMPNGVGMLYKIVDIRLTRENDRTYVDVHTEITIGSRTVHSGVFPPLWFDDDSVARRDYYETLIRDWESKMEQLIGADRNPMRRAENQVATEQACADEYLYDHATQQYLKVLGEVMRLEHVARSGRILTGISRVLLSTVQMLAVGSRTGQAEPLLERLVADPLGSVLRDKSVIGAGDESAALWSAEDVERAVLKARDTRSVVQRIESSAQGLVAVVHQWVRSDDRWHADEMAGMHVRKAGYPPVERSLRLIDTVLRKKG